MSGEQSDTYTETGSPLVLDVETQTVQQSTITEYLTVEDDDDIRWGTDEDYVTEFDSSEDEWRLFDNGSNDNLLNAGTTEIVFNEDGVDLDFRVEGSADTELLRTDAANDRVGIGTNSPESALDVSGGDIELDNQQYIIGESTGNSDTQLIGVSGTDVVLVGDISGNGFNTQIEANGTVGIDVQTTGNVNFDNGNLRVNADNNKIEWGAGQDASIQYDGTDLVLNPQEVGSGSFKVSGPLNLQGNDITQVGGTTDASSGAIRLANDSSISWRDSGNGADIGVKLSANDRIEAGASIEVTGNSTFVHDRQDVSTDVSSDGSGYYSIDSSGGVRTFTISGSDEVDGKEINVKRNGGNNVNVNSTDPGTTSIDDATTTPQYTLSSDNESVTFVYNSSNDDWEVY